MKTLEELKQEVLSEYDEKVIALAQHLGLDINFDESDYELNPDNLDVEFTQEEIEENEKEKQEGLDEAINDFRNELDSIVETFPNNFRYSYEDYLVLTDEEADEEEDERLDNYIDECLEIPDNIRPYFDDEAWKRDARMDGRGHIISSYDGEEYEEKVNDTWYYIYRV